LIVGRDLDVRRLRSIRYNAFLIGERLMRDADPGSALAAIIANAGTEER